jgi:hypothetical protein
MILAVFSPQTRDARWFIFSNQNHNLGLVNVENVGIFYDYLEYFTAIWYTL